MDTIIKMIRDTQKTGDLPLEVRMSMTQGEAETFTNLVNIANDSGLDDMGLGKLISQTVLSKYAV